MASDKASSSSLATSLRENRTLIIGASIVAAAAVAAGVVYLSSKSQSAPKKKKAGKARKPVASRAAKAAVPLTKEGSKESPVDIKTDAPSEEKVESPATETPEVAPVRPEDLTEEERSKQAAQIKGKGNKFYNARLYDKAINAYSQAIEMCPPSDTNQLAVFYANRAACHAALNRHDEVIFDCSKALEYDPKYSKAYSRRAQAYESKSQIEDAIIDLTTVINLQKNLPLEKNAPTIEIYDRLMKSVAQDEIKNILKSREPQWTSKVFVKAYFESFRNANEYNDGTSIEELNGLISEKSDDADLYMRRGWAYIKTRDYEKSMDDFSRAVELDNAKRPAEAFHMRGSFRYLMRQPELALEDFNRALDIEPTNVQVLLKRAGLRLEQRDPDGCTADLALAERHGENDPDVYHQRGQMRFLSEDILGAIQDYRRACEYGQNSPLARIQLAIALWRGQDVDEALKIFDQVRKEHPDNSDVHNFLGEIYMAEGDWVSARESFQKAHDLDPESPMSLVNLGLLSFRRSFALNPMAAGGMGMGDFGMGFGSGAGASAEELEEVEQARKYLIKAIEVDPKFDMAHAHLAQVHMRQEHIDLAVECYEKTVELARTEDDLLNAVMCKIAAKAQLEASRRLKQN